MTKGKAELKKRKFSLTEVLFFTGVTIAIAFLAEYYVLAPKGLTEIFLFIFGICIFLGTYFWKEEMFILWSVYLTIAGTFIGGLLNITLSTEFLSEPSIIFLLVHLFIICILLWASFTLRKDISWIKKLGFVFLGCWIISLVFALSGFIKILIQWLSLLPSQEMTGGHIQVEASVIINILKSLFLSGLFNVLERVMRLSKEAVK
jgi:hypothetical protein